MGFHTRINPAASAPSTTGINTKNLAFPRAAKHDSHRAACPDRVGDRAKPAGRGIDIKIHDRVAALVACAQQLT